METNKHVYKLYEIEANEILKNKAPYESIIPFEDISLKKTLLWSLKCQSMKEPNQNNLWYLITEKKNLC